MDPSSQQKIKNEILNLVDQIVLYEDKLNQYNDNSLYKSAIIDMEKNKESIKLLKSLIKNENETKDEKINKLNQEISDLSEQLKSLKKPSNNVAYSQRDYEHNLIKQKCFEKTLFIYNNEYISIESNISMLKEEKKTCEYELCELMSNKETYEETLISYSKFIFKNLIISYDNINCNSISVSTSITQFTNNCLNIEKYELVNLQITKLVIYLFDNILSKFITSLEDSIKTNLMSIVENIYIEYINSMNPSSPNDFIYNLSETIVNSEPKFINFIDKTKFQIALKYLIKIFYIDKIITDRLEFINKDYKKYKANYKKMLNVSKDKINLINDKINKEKNQGKLINDFLFNVNNYEDNMQQLSYEINDKNKQIEMLNQERENNINNYNSKIEEIQKINNLLNLQYNSEKVENEIKNIKSKIDELFYQIKNILKNSGDLENELLNMFIRDINNTVDSSNREDNVNINEINIRESINMNTNNSCTLKDNEMSLTEDKENINQVNELENNNSILTVNSRRKNNNFS